MREVPAALKPPDPTHLLRFARLQDVQSLHQNCWSERSSADVYQIVSRSQQNIQRGRGLGVVAVDRETQAVIGFGQLTVWPRCGEISDLVVAEAQRRHGIGTAMIQYLMRAAREMQCSCVEIGVALSNPHALALYRRLGFRDDHTVRLNLGNGEETVLYLRIEII